MRSWRAAVAALGAVAVAVGVSVAPAQSAYAGTVTLPTPVPGSAPGMDQAFAQLMILSGMDVPEICLELTNTAASTHVLKGTASDQTLGCGVPDYAAGLSRVEQFEKLVWGVRQSFSSDVFPYSTHPAYNLNLRNFLSSWADRLTPCGDAWVRVTLGRLDERSYSDTGTEYQNRMVWDKCVLDASNPPDPDPGADGGTDTDPGGGVVTDPVPDTRTYLERVTDRLMNDALIRRDRSPNRAQAKRVARACIKAEEAARAAGVMEGNPCTDAAVFFPGADAGHAALHDAEAIAKQPSWSTLTYMSGTDKKNSGVKKDWYDIVRYRPLCGDNREARGVDCDEYPFYATVEGGPGASLKEVPLKENRAEGNALGRMYSDPDCEMKGFGSGTKRYFVVPVAVAVTAPDTGQVSFAGPPSMHVCVPEARVPAPWDGGPS